MYFIVSCRPTSMFASVIWPKGKPPSDIPECGFNDENCEWLKNGKEQLRTEADKKINIQLHLIFQRYNHYCYFYETQKLHCWLSL